MTVKLILWLCIVWLPVLMYFMLANEAKFKKNIVVGVTLPYLSREDGEVVSRLRKFKKQSGWICAALLVLGVAGIFLPQNLSMTLWGLWVLLAVILPYVPYVLCNRDLKRLKLARGWKPGNRDLVTVDTAGMAPLKWMSPWMFLPPLLVSLLPLAWARGFWMLYLVNAVCVVLFWFCYRYLFRNRTERVDDNAQLTKVLTQVRRHNWGKMWLLCAWCMALISPIMALAMASPLLMIVLFVALMVVMIVFAMRIEFRLRRVQEKLTADSGRSCYVDEDDKWIWGMFYYDPRDRHLIVNNRVGSNTSVNLARPAGKVLMTFVVVVLLIIPFIFPLVQSAADRPMPLEISGEVLDSGKYELPLAEIAEVELLENLPNGLMRVMGTSMPNLLRGNFTSPETGNVKVSLDPTEGPWLLVKMQSGEKYLLGSRDAAAVEAVFEQLNR